MPISSQQKKAATRKLVVTPPPLKGRGAPPGGGHVTKAEVLARMKENNAVVVVDGRLVSVDGIPVSPIDKTLAEFLALTPSQVADGAVVHITNVHGPSGAGGVYATWDAVASKWGQNFGTPWVFSTLALLTASFPAASWEGWSFRVTVINGDLISNGTKYVPKNGRIPLVGLMYGIPGTPTKNSGTGTSTYSFNIDSPTFPAGLFGAGKARLYLKSRMQRHNGGTPANIVVAIRLGTDTVTPTNNRPLWSNTITTTDLTQSPSEVYIEIPDATHFVTNSSNGQSGSGATNNLTTETTNVNVASAMVLSVDITSKNTNDTLDLLSLSLEWGEF